MPAFVFVGRKGGFLHAGFTESSHDEGTRGSGVSRGFVMQKRAMMFVTLTVLAVSAMAATGSAEKSFAASTSLGFLGSR